MLRMLLVIVLGLFAVRTCTAQEVSRARVWGAIGAGGSMPTSGGDAITNLAQLVYEKRSLHGAFRILLLHDIDRHTNEIGEISPLYGRTREHSWGRSAISTGFSWVGFFRCPDDLDSCSTLGVPLVAEAAIGGKFAGLGIQGFANINGTASYAGAVLFLEIGRLR